LVVVFYRDGSAPSVLHRDANRRQAETIEAKLKEDVNKQRFQIAATDRTPPFGELAERFTESGSVRPHHRYH